MNQGHLYRTRTYLVGHMQYVGDKQGESWRDRITKPLTEMGIIVFNPYHKPFVRDVQEGNEVGKKLAQAQNDGDFEYVSNKMKEIRIFDLNLVDRSDFIIAHIQPSIASWGSAEEIVTAVRMKKPIFLSVQGGKKACPLWIYGMFPHKYIYDSPDDVIEMLTKINNGEKAIDDERWKLLRKEYR